MEGVAKNPFVNVIVVPEADDVISSPDSTLFSKLTVNFKSCTLALTLLLSEVILHLNLKNRPLIVLCWAIFWNDEIFARSVLSAPTCISAPHWISLDPSNGALASSNKVAPRPESNKSYSS